MASPVGVSAAAAGSGGGASVGNDDQWRVFMGLALLVAAYVFRVEVVRFTLRLARRVLPPMFVWIKEFEKHMLRPLSWVVFILLVWFSLYVMDLANLVGMDPDTITSVVTLLLGLPLIWVVINFCNYITWGIIRVQGWKRTASKDDDDYSRVMIVTEGIGVIKFLLVAAVVSAFMVDEIGKITSFDSTQITTVAVLMVEFVFVFGAHSWMKNIMGGLMSLKDEQVKSGSHISLQGHRGVVERLYLQGFALRQYDKGLAYIPNGALLENTVTVRSREMDQRIIASVHVSHSTKAATLRLFIQELDAVLSRIFVEKHERDRSKAATALGLRKRSNMHWGKSLNKVERLQIMWATGDSEDAVQQRFWIAIERAYVITVTYYSHEHHVRDVMHEKTEIILQITELLKKFRIDLYEAGGTTSSASKPSAANIHKSASLPPSARSARASRPASSPHISTVIGGEETGERRDLRFGPATEPGRLNRLRRNNPDQSGGEVGGARSDFRRRRPHSSAAVTLL